MSKIVSVQYFFSCVQFKSRRLRHFLFFCSPTLSGCREQALRADCMGFPCRTAPPALSGGSILAHPSPLLRLKLFMAPHLVASRLDVVVDDPFAVPRRRISSLLCSLSVVVARRRRAFSVGGLPVSDLFRPCVGPSWCLLCCNSSFFSSSSHCGVPGAHCSVLLASRLLQLPAPPGALFSLFSCFFPRECCVCRNSVCGFPRRVGQFWCFRPPSRLYFPASFLSLCSLWVPPPLLNCLILL